MRVDEIIGERSLRRAAGVSLPVRCDSLHVGDGGIPESQLYRWADATPLAGMRFEFIQYSGGIVVLNSMKSLLCVVIISLVCQHAIGDDWTQFLGPQRNGISAEKNLIDTWPVGGPKIAWRTPLGVSMSGVAVANGAAVTMFQDDASQFVACLNAADGRERWRTPVAPMYENAMGHGPRATPTVADGHVFAFTGEGILTALKVDDGKQLWLLMCLSCSKGNPMNTVCRVLRWSTTAWL